MLVTSLSYPKSGNRMNMIQMHSIADLREALQWKVTAVAKEQSSSSRT